MTFMILPSLTTRRDPFLGLVAALRRRRTRFVPIGVAGANYWARSGAAIFSTEDFDLLLPADAGQLLRAWRACEAQGLELWLGDEPLDRPRNLTLAEVVCERRALVRASGRDLKVDLTLVMSGFSFEDVWPKGASSSSTLCAFPWPGFARSSNRRRSPAAPRTASSWPHTRRRSGN